MADLFKKDAADALSKLIQLQAGRYEIQLNWSGHGVNDLIALCNAHAVKARISKHLWVGMQELTRMPEMAQLPEAVQAHIASIVLKSQALVDLDNDAHATRLAAHPSNKPRDPLIPQRS